MPDYSNGKIYKLVCNITRKIYYGSTTQKLSGRKGGHLSDYKRYTKDNTIHKCASIEIIKNNDFDIILVESYPCKNKDELRQREQFYIENNICVNKINAFGLAWDKPHHCEVCDITLHSYEYFELNHKNSISHIFKLEDSKPTYFCEECKKDIHKVEKVRHENSEMHKNNGKYIARMKVWHCDICDIDLVYGDNVSGINQMRDRHIKTKKHINKQNNFNNKECPKCQKIFSSTSKMRRHLNSVHIKDGIEVPPKPTKQEKNKEKYLKRKEAGENYKPYFCEVCKITLNFYKKKRHESRATHLDKIKNKDIIPDKDQYKCEDCCVIMTKNNKTRHEKTKKHLKNLSINKCPL